MTSQAVPPAPLWTRRFVLSVIAQTVFGFGWSLYLIAPKFLALVLKADAEAIGRVSAASGVAAVLAIPLAAAGLDRVGRRPFFQLGSALIVLLSAMYLAVDHMGPLVYLAQGLTGAAFVLAFNGNATLVADFAPPERLGQAIGVIGAANVSMNAVATVVAEQVAETWGWPVVFRLGLGAGGLALVLSLFVSESPRRARPAVAATPGALVPGPVRAFLLATILIGGAFTAIFTFHQPYALSLGARQLRSFFIGFTTAAVFSRVMFGTLGDRYGHRRVSLAAAVLYAISALTMVRLDPARLWIYGSIFGFAHGVLYPTLNALVLQRMPPSSRGRAMTFYNGAFNVGGALSGAAWGVIAQRVGYRSVFWGALALGLGAAALLVERPVREA